MSVYIFRVVAGDVNDEDSLGGALTISADKMKQSLMCAENKTSEKEIEEMLKALDLDQDGKVGMDDFVRLLIAPDAGLCSKNKMMRENSNKISEEDEDEEDESEENGKNRHKKCCIL